MDSVAIEALDHPRGVQRIVSKHGDQAVTPAMAMALVASAAGNFGHLVMKAITRNRGVAYWDSAGRSMASASGLLDRIDALCFAAPVFSHSVRWNFNC